MGSLPLFFFKLVLLLLLEKEHLPISIKRFETFLRVAIGFNIKLLFLRQNKKSYKARSSCFTVSIDGTFAERVKILWFYYFTITFCQAITNIYSLIFRKEMKL